MKVHFISIGGSVMHQLAIALKKKGYLVTGSDDEIFNPASDNLQKEGLLPEALGWFPEKIYSGLDVVLLGMHAKEDNPELKKARELGLKIYSFPEFIFQESINKKRIAIGGSHGKTTVTAMLMHVFSKCLSSFDYVVGAKLKNFEGSVQITDAPFIVCEADEYPASAIMKQPKFHFLYPHIAVITGLAWDHINVFPTFEDYLQQFVIFMERIEPNGVLIYNETDEVLQKLVEEHKRTDIRYVPYGLPEYSIQNGVTTVVINDMKTDLNVFGMHNLLNLHAAYCVCKEIGITNREFMTNIGDFSGASKRLELLTKNAQTNIYRDFAHAPSKVKATIKALKEQFPSRKLVAVLELHTYSSLNKNFMSQYRGAMQQADVAIVYFSKHALQLKRLPELPVKAVEEGFGKEGLKVISDKESLLALLKGMSYDNANLLLMSSGDYDGVYVFALAEELVKM